MTTAFGGATLAFVAGLLGGRLLVAGVTRLLGPAGDGKQAPNSRSPWAASVVVACAALGLWWWEASALGLAPDGVGEPASIVATRLAAHGILMLLLAAATWIDLRHRVIPDAITVPGVLGGLAWIATCPGALLPVAREVPRSFAQPLLEADVLGLVGPLHGPWPDWLAAAPSPWGLVAAIAVFAIWWLVGTDPAAPPDRSRAAWAWLATPRTVVAAVGLAIVAGAWLVGGDHWRAFVTALAGLAVSGGIVWLTRAGASLALGREAMGLGDVTLMAMVGAWLGWQPCVLTCLLGVFIGLAHGVGQLVLRGEAELPFGPSLCLAAAAVVVGWRPIWERTEAFFEQPLEMAAVVVAVIALTGATLWCWHRLRRFPAD